MENAKICKCRGEENKNEKLFGETRGLFLLNGQSIPQCVTVVKFCAYVAKV